MKNFITEMHSLVRGIPINYNLKMKITAILFVFAFVQINAANSFGQNTKVSLKMKEVSIQNILNRIEQKTDYKFLYEKNVFQSNKLVSVNVKNEKLSIVLDKLFKDQNVTLVYLEKQIVIKTKLETNIVSLPKNLEPETSIDQQSISGVVLDENEVPLPGASIIEKGTTNGTQSDFDGNFTLDVRDGAILQISYLGFIAQEIAVAGQSSIKVKLKADTAALDEVVVVGYGTQKKTNLTGAVGVVTADDIGSQAITSAATAMHGRVAGVQMIQGSSQPGNSSPTFQIRGVGTVRTNINEQNSASAPLILIDGVQASMDDLNPNDIESFSVLKDAASAAIYGVRAANGVVLITTKRGKGGSPKISFNSYYGFQNATTTPDMLNPYEFVLMMNEAYTNIGQNPLYSDDIVDVVKSGTDPRFYNKSFFDEGYKSNAPLINHYLSVRGGNENTKYMFSVGMQDQQGIVIETSSKRYNFRSNIDSKLSDKLSAGFNVSGSMSNSYEPNYYGLGPTQFVRDMIRKYPLTPIFQEDGFISRGNSLLSNAQDQNLINPIAYAKFGGKNNDRTLNFIPNLFLEYSPLKELKIKANGSVNITNIRNTDRRNKLTVSNGTSVTTANGLGTLIERTSNTYNSLFELTAIYNKNFGKSNITVLGGYAFQKNRHDFSSGQNEGYNYNLNELNAGEANPSVSGFATEYATESVFGRLNYSYDDKYLFEANIRRDGSSRFGDDNKYGIFPSFSAGWNIAKEQFLEDSNFINQLKLRASWGQLGNDNIGNYNQIATINLSQPYVFGNSLAPGAAVTSLNNSEIKWETTTSKDIGIDARLFENRVSLTADYYVRTGTDVLLTPPIPLTLGNVSPPVQNFGKIENKGWEMLISYSGNIGDDFTFDVSANWTHNDNKVLKLDTEFISSNKVITREGSPINAFYGHIIKGIFQTDAEAQDSETYGVQPGGASTKAGDYIWEDTNNDGIVDSKDRVIIGDPNIRNNYGFSLSMGYKGFDFRTVFQGVLGRDVEQGVFGFDGRANMNLTKDWLNRWTPNNTNTNIPRVARGYRYNTSLFVGPSISAAVVDASYLRMKHIELGYNIPDSVLSKIGFSKIRLYVAGENLLTFTNFTNGFDPEDARTFNNVNDSYPLAKTYTFGINLSL